MTPTDMHPSLKKSPCAASIFNGPNLDLADYSRATAHLQPHKRSGHRYTALDPCVTSTSDDRTTMSSPPDGPGGVPAARDMDLDAEMQDASTQDATARPDGDQDMTTQTDTQQPATGSGLGHQNRKDVTLREFLSKMDDYAPIVRTLS